MRKPTDHRNGPSGRWRVTMGSESIIIFAFILILGFLTSCKTNSTEHKAWLNKGQYHFKMGKYGKAIEAFNKAIKSNPKYAEAYFIRGRSYDLKGQQIKGAYERNVLFKKAIADYTKAIEINPMYAPAYNYRGIVHSKNWNSTDAMADFTKAIEINPRDAFVYVNRGFYIYYDANQGNPYNRRRPLEKAIADFTRAIELSPKYAWAYYIRGKAYNLRNFYDRAIADYTAAIEIDSNLAEAWCYRGKAYNNKGLLDKAITDLTRAIEINPKYRQAYYFRGKVNYNKGNYDMAILDYTKSLEIDKKDACFTYNSRGNVYLKKGKYDQAFEDYSKAMELYPGYEWFHYNLAHLYCLKKDKDNALKYFLSAIANGFNDLPQIQSNKDLDFIRDEKEFQEMQTIVVNCSRENNPGRVCVNYSLACLYSLKKDKDNALAYLSRAIWYGFNDLPQIQNNKDLDFIRATKEFKEIIGKLTSK